MIQINMLGRFRLEYNGKVIDEDDNRQNKLWALLAYIIYNHDKKIPLDDVFTFLWDKPEKVTNRVSAVKTTIHRLRLMLDNLGTGMGMELITYENGGYQWNPSYEFELDAYRFEALVASRKPTDWYKAIMIYEDDFLVRFHKSASWIIPVSDRYHEMYLQATDKVCNRLEKSGSYHDLLSVSRKAIELDAYDEAVYRHHMNALLNLGRETEAVRIYEKMSGIFISDNGRVPSDEARIIYRKALEKSGEKVIPIDELHLELMESDAPKGAYLAGYDFFKTVYQIIARSVSRIEGGAHIALITVRPPVGRKLQERSINVAIENLQHHILSNLRRGDAVTKCSYTQFVILLPTADYENSKAICERIKASFYRQHSHSPVELFFSIQPVKQS